MELSILLAKQIVAMFIIAVIGFCLIRYGMFEDRDTNFLAKINIYIVRPCAIICSLQMAFSMEKLKGFMAALVAAVIIHVVFIAVAIVLRKVFKLSAVEEGSIIYPNSLNLILPLIIATLSEEMRFFCMAFVVVQLFFIWTHGLKLIINKGGFKLSNLKNPNLISTAIGFGLFLLNISLPDVPYAAMNSIGGMLGPASMLIIGMMFGNTSIRAAVTNGRAYFIASLRLIVFPIIAIVILLLLNDLFAMINIDTKSIFLVTLIAASSCTASTIPQMENVYGDGGNSYAGSYASIICVVNMALCTITMPLIIYAYQMAVSIFCN